ncbi:polyprenyl synthetase family protein [Lactobacillus hamsteri]|uniref:Trans-hexaprenyltranstransferase n=1 Tax=Lactobacillus hamsteri DSM 5661 = JCM 6256 TaxID=1423754 RepID=A0A0R1Y7S6_9LACO|nr:polyprenyl synthetase family protein [Lactobacillus hamsteri]KRM38450.1 trans-hexaprenyltranstransferase [Lactobacillus hamsteri DSM 5661 = JCM 6256]
MNIEKTWQKFPLIKEPLEKVNQCIEETIQTPYSDLQAALLEMANNGGKYLRPSLLILSAKIASQKKEVSPRIIKLASSIEILHMASLIHDDIIDDSNERRGKISIQARFGKDIAVYAGDLLFTNFFDLILDTVSSHQYMVKNAHAMRKILDGELGQMAERFNINQTFDNYLANVRGKTAALFRLAAEEGAYFAEGDDKTIKIMADFGENLGIAFQMIDDILDYTGSKKLNKPILEDLATGVYSLPLLLALQDGNLSTELIPILNKKYQITIDDIQKIQKIILNSSIINLSRNIAKTYTHDALDNLAQLPASPEKNMLEKLTKQLLNRSM